MSNNVEHALRAFIAKKEDELAGLNDMIETLEDTLRSAPRDADKLFVAQATTYCVRLRIERAQKIRDLNAYHDEFMTYSEDVE